MRALEEAKNVETYVAPPAPESKPENCRGGGCCQTAASAYVTTMRAALLALPFLLTACGGAPEADVPMEEMTLEARGRLVWKKCQTCHSLGEGQRHKVGPNLHGLFGSVAGSKDRFAYSKAMSASDVVWDADTLDPYLRKPAEYMKGTRMSFVGLKRPEDREAVIAYLREETK